MNVWVVEYDYGDNARGVAGVWKSFDEAVAHTKMTHQANVVWETADPVKAVIGGRWIFRGTKHDTVSPYADLRFVAFYFTEHTVLPV